MRQFFLHKKFWLPIVVVLLMLVVLEGVLRLGWYDRIHTPNSHLGNSLSRVDSIKKMGTNQIDWITLGDSKVDWGINHQRVREAQAAKGLKHARMSLAGSNFLTIQTSTEWAFQTLPNLQGIVLGMYENEFTTPSNPIKEFKISWPFRQHVKHDQFNYFRRFSQPEIWLNSLAITNYAADIKNLFLNPILRMRVIKNHQNKKKHWLAHLDKKRDMSGNLCQYDLSDLAGCINSAKQFNNLKDVPTTFQSPYKNCISQRAQVRLDRNQLTTRPRDHAEFLKQWTYLFDQILAHDKQLTLLLLPENEFFSYMSKPSNTQDLVQQLIDQYSENPRFKLIDLRDLFKTGGDCQNYYDNLHFNNQGIEKVTDALLSRL